MPGMFINTSLKFGFLYTYLPVYVYNVNSSVLSLVKYILFVTQLFYFQIVVGDHNGELQCLGMKKGETVVRT